jgi:hypothetical protein
MSWLLLGIVGVIAAALLIIIFAPKSRNRNRSRYRETEEVPLAATRVAEETHHGARAGTIQGMGVMDGVGPFTGALPRRKEKKK